MNKYIKHKRGVFAHFLSVVCFLCISIEALAQSVIGSYDFEIHDSSVFTDNSNLIRPIDTYGSPSLSSGISGNAVRFDGVNQYAKMFDTNGIFLSSQKKSLSFWFKTPLESSGGTVLSLLSNEACESLHIAIEGLGNQKRLFKLVNGCNSGATAGFVFEQSDMFKHVAVTLTEESLSVYLDSKWIYTQPVRYGGDFTYLCLGGEVDNLGCSDLFQGDIDGFKLFDGELSKAQIESYFLAEFPAPTPPNMLNAVYDQQLGHILLSWQAAFGSADPEDVSYLIYRDGELVDSGIQWVEYVDQNILPNKEYSYYIVAVDEYGQLSEQSDVVVVFSAPREDLEPPDVPSELSVEENTPGQISIRWSPVSDNGGAEVDSYNIYRNGVYYSRTQSSETLFTDSDVSPGERYVYQISVVDNTLNKNESLKSNALEVVNNAGGEHSCLLPLNNDVGSAPPSANSVFNSPNLVIQKATTTVDWGDINGDGLADIFAAEGGKHSCGENCMSLSWFEAPNWQEHKLGDLLGEFTGDSTLADIDSDGDLDVVVSADAHNRDSLSDGVYWYENRINVQLTWVKHVIESDVPDAFHIGDLEVGDMDGDGLLDVVIRHLGVHRFVVYFQNQSSTWTPLRINTRHREGLSVSDMDGDGKADIIGNGFILFSPANSRTDPWQEVIVDSSYFNQSQIQLNNSTKSTTADFNKDGRKDILFSTAEGAGNYLAWFEAPQQARTGQWIRHIIESPQGNNHQALAADIDNDGDIDVAGGFSFGSVGVYWWENVDGIGNTWTRNAITTEVGCYSCELIDFDNDGDIDLMGPEKYVGNIFLYENNSQSGSNPGGGSGEGLLFDINENLTHYLTLDSKDSNGIVKSITSDLKLSAPANTSFASGVVNGGYLSQIGQPLVANELNLEASNEISLTAWVKLEDFSSVEGRILSQAYSTQSSGHYLMLSQINGSGVRARIKINNNTYTVASANGVLQLDQWQHIVATFNGSSIKLFVDAFLVAQLDISGQLSRDSSVDFAIGNQPPGAGDRPFNGMIDEVRIYDKALSQSQINALKNYNGYNCQ